MANLTRADKDALTRLPKGWFIPDNVHFMVRNPRARCERFKRLGFVESEVVGDDIFSLHTRYRLTKTGIANVPVS